MNDRPRLRRPTRSTPTAYRRDRQRRLGDGPYPCHPVPAWTVLLHQDGPRSPGQDDILQTRKRLIAPGATPARQPSAALTTPVGRAPRRELDGAGRGGTMVGVAAVAEDEPENERQEDQPDSEGVPVAEALRQVERNDDPDDDVHDRDQQEDDPPPGASDDPEHDQGVPDRDDAFPTGLARFGKDLPEGEDDDEPDEDVDDPNDGAHAGCLLGQTVGLSLTAWPDGRPGDRVRCSARASRGREAGGTSAQVLGRLHVDALISRHVYDRLMKLCVVGLGRLGLPWALVADSAGHDVRGLDVNGERVDAINERRVETSEPEVAALLADPGCGLFATTVPAEALADAELSVVAVPSPSNGDGSFGLEAVIAAIEAIGAHANRLAPRHVVVLKSTVSPGATRGPVRRALADATGPDNELGLVYTPEFHAVGTIVRDIRHPYLLILGGDQEWSLSRAEELHRSLTNSVVPVARLDPTGAELAKLASNSFRTMKISFANSLAALCAAYGTDPVPVCAAVAADPHIGGGYLRPGLPYGGPCYPRDNPALRAAATAADQTATLAQAAEQANDRHFHELEHAGLNAPPGPIGIVGLGYKPGSDELEGSPPLELARRWRAAGREVALHDPRATGFDSQTVDSLGTILDTCSIILLASPDADLLTIFRAELAARTRHPPVIDPWGALGPQPRFGE